MTLARRIKQIARMMGCFLRRPRHSSRYLYKLPEDLQAAEFCQQWAGAQDPVAPAAASAPDSANPLWSYFAAHQQGRGIWKWVHYFDIYHRHLQKFVGTDVHVVEIGIFSGGSLPMWRHYFGPNCRITGVDIEEACRVYEDAGAKIFIGDQASRPFWKTFREQAPAVDVLIDDGGHTPEQQQVTLEETLPYLRPGGVYLCEDVHGVDNRFAAYVHSLADKLNAFDLVPTQEPGKQAVCRPTSFQAAIHSVHLYPYVVAIEKAKAPVDQFVAPRHGTEWQPFL